MEKTRINNIAAVGIIYRATDPSQIFIEAKDGTHPIKLVRGQLCFIGGNWIGEGAANDTNTRDTFSRELREELSFERPVRDSHEYALLGVAGRSTFSPTPAPNVAPTDDDYQRLEEIKGRIVTECVPFGDFLNTVPKSVLDAADPENTRDGFTSLASYWAVPVREAVWEALEGLQRKFGNLSNESVTLVVSLDEILERSIFTAFGHDRVLQRFFLEQGLSAAEDLPLVLGISSFHVGLPLASYEDYLARYEVAKRPPLPQTRQEGQRLKEETK